MKPSCWAHKFAYPCGTIEETVLFTEGEKNLIVPKQTKMMCKFPLDLAKKIKKFYIYSLRDLGI